MEMHTVVPGCPNFIWCELTADAADVRQLRPFLASAAGPGFIDWWPNWWSVCDRGYWRLRAAPRPPGREPVSAEAARALAWRYADAGAKLHELERDRAAQNPTRLPLDLASLIPIPDDVLEHGFDPAGERWLFDHWGTPAPLRRVTFRMERRQRNGHIEQVGVFQFIAENWAPWLAVRAMQQRWPDIRFEMTCRYD